MGSLAGALAAHSNDTNLISNATKFTIRQQHRRTYLPTFNSFSSMVDVSYPHLPTEHSLFHAHVPLSATEVLLSLNRACVEQFTGYYKTDHKLRTA